MSMPPRDLPPPPPPAHLREWLDEDAVRADRARFLADLSRRSLGLERLLLLWAVAALFVIGWTFVGMAVAAFASGDPLSCFFGFVFGLIGLGVLVPAGSWFVRGFRQERQLSRLLWAWVEAVRDPAARAGGLRAPGRSLVWLAGSLALGGTGLWVAFGAAAAARPGEHTYGEVGYFMGLGMILWITGLLGLARAGVHHHRLARSGRPVRAARQALPVLRDTAY
ncbi:hypothetical protein AB0D46_32225 [Streptomyces sp. NPDC048383]|uniref:hypothetical protein n=1 Tax=Streptomyces sp. NPDC048383 TaxID=3155386 RepID=UPI00343DED2F